MRPTDRAEASRPGDAGDAQVVRALRAGDERAFLALVERHHGAMVRVAKAFVRSEAVAEEVAQEAWLGVLAGLPGFEGRGALRGWIFRILVNQAKARAAREVRTIPLSALDDPDGETEPSVPAARFRGPDDPWPGHWVDPPSAWPDEQAASREAVALVGATLEDLPALPRAVMTLRDVDGLEAGEVCELLGISATHQRVLLHRARSAVRARLEAHLGRDHAGNGGEP